MLKILSIIGINIYFMCTGIATSSVSIDEIRQQHVRIMQLLDLSIVLPLIQDKQIIPREDFDKVADTKHAEEYQFQMVH